ncbi:MAG: HD domain-containing protein [Lachnospiraceae bacterium]|nr:HD domain-containing protein [Lachnospiraceae bacterium]
MKKQTSILFKSLPGRQASRLASILLVLVLTVLSAVPTHAEGAARRDILGTGTDYTAILYDSSNGLPTSEANAIVQSADGFIWLGGYSGLILYDGSSFLRFDSSSGISSVFSLFVDSKDRIWIGTNENGISYYDHGEIKNYGRVEGLKSYSIRSILEDPDGNIIIATTQGLAYIGDDMEIHVIDDPQINLEYITELQKDKNGRIYGLTLNGAVFELESLRISAFYHPEEFGSEPVNTIYPDPDNASLLYMGTTGSEFLTVDVSRNMTVARRQETGSLKNLNAILKINNRLWLSATNGIGYFDEFGRCQELSDVPMNNSIGNIMTDHEGNIWFTSTRQGVLKLVPDRFTDISKFAGLDSMVVNSTCINSGLLYLGTDKGLTILDNTSLTPVTNELTEMLTGIRIRCIKNDSRGNIWFCTHGEYGLVCYCPADGSIFTYNEANGLNSSGRVRAMMECSDGSIAATTSNGLFILKNGEVTAHYGQENGISTTEILSVEEGPDHKLYLGSDGDGIYVIDGNKVSRISHADGLTSEVVMRIKWDAEREVFWLITSNSIQYMKDNQATAVTNFPYSNNYDIYFNDHGGAWVLASNGIYITTVSELLANENIEYSFYNTRSGLPYIATGNSRSYLDEKGNLYISGTTGVCKVDINTSDDSNRDVKLAIPCVELDGKRVFFDPGSTVSIPAGCKRLTINAYALTYGLSNPRISYYLENFDKSPIHTTKQEMQPVIYTNLDGGKYIFHMDVIDDETGQIEKSILLTIVKETSPYENILFWISLMCAGILSITFLIWRHFKKKNEALLEKQAEDLEYINQIMHTFAKCIDMRDTQNRGHSFRVAYYTRLLATKLAEKRGYTDEQINDFYNTALLHDIGKLSIPDAILNKTERLNDEEYVIMKSHAEKGEELLKSIDVVQDLAVGAGCHHERMDGRGYPHALKGEDIPEVARIIAVADTFDAMYSTRPYRKQMLLSDVLDEIRRIRGTQLEEEVVDALFALVEENALDKEKVDAAVAAIGSMNMQTLPEDPAASETDEEELKRRNEAFQKSLGLHNSDARTQDKK